MPPKRARKDVEVEESAPQANRPVKRAKTSAVPAPKQPATKPANATAKKAAPKKAAAATKAKAAAVKKAAASKAPPKKAAKPTPTPPVPETNGHIVKPAAKKKETPAPAPAPKDPLDVAYAIPVPPLKSLRNKKVVNDFVPQTAPTLDIFVCGEGSNGELGLGTAKKQMDVKRPRFNAFISSKDIIKVATGGMHVLALSKDGQIYSWGVNDQGALGRDTRWEGVLKDIDEDEDSDSDDDDADSGMNPHEANPAAIDPAFFHPGTVIVDIVAADSSSFALTAEGRVYGWGTFRSNEGILGFAQGIDVQRTPYLLEKLVNITKLAAGENHVLALDSAGKVFAWGSGQQSQLGRRIVERTKENGLMPAPLALTVPGKHRSAKAVDIGCGTYNSFAIDTDGNVWSWGANSYGECGQFENAGEDRAIVLQPTLIESLQKRNVTRIEGGAHHTVAVTASGECLVWGRCDGGQTGIDLAKLDKDHVITGSGKTAAEVEKSEGSVETRTYKILAHPTAIPALGTNAVYAACGSDHTIILTKAGKAYTSGFSANYQTGQGTDDDIDEATVIDNTATRDRKLIWAGAGGQYSSFAAEKKAA